MCNCRQKNNCPLDGKCLTKCVVYKATVTETDTKKQETHIGLTRPTYTISSTGLFQPDIFARPHQEVLVHCRLVHCDLVRCRLKLLLLRILFSELKADVFSCVGRWKIVLFVCLEKGGCRQYRPSPMCTSCIYRLLVCMVVPFQGSSTLLYGL